MTDSSPLVIFKNPDRKSVDIICRFLDLKWSFELCDAEAVNVEMNLTSSLLSFSLFLMSSSSRRARSRSWRRRCHSFSCSFSAWLFSCEKSTNKHFSATTSMKGNAPLWEATERHQHWPSAWLWTAEGWPVACGSAAHCSSTASSAPSSSAPAQQTDASSELPPGSGWCQSWPTGKQKEMFNK